MQSPIAVVAIGGLVAGGFLALLAIPAAYKIYWGYACTWVEAATARYKIVRRFVSNRRRRGDF